MKKISLLLLSILMICAIYLCAQMKEKPVRACEYKYLRVHILANSNSNKDQEIKYQVKGRVVDYLTPYLAECGDYHSAEKLVSDNLSIINSIIINELKNNGLSYSSNTELLLENCPTRYYESLVLEQGDYMTLKITLGEGKGDNWWCVVYPPLCFVNKFNVNEQNIIYQSKIVEILKNFFE